MTSPFPCKDCPDRYVGCHSKCERYLAVKRDHDKQREEAYSRYEATAYIKERIARGRDSIAKTRRNTKGYKWLKGH